MDQPDVRLQFALFCQFKIDRRGEHHGHGSGVIVVGPGGGDPRPADLAGGIAVDVLHVGRVVVVGHDDRPAAVLAGNDHEDVALVGLAVLVPLPAAGPGELEVGLPAEGQLADNGLAGHAGRRGQLGVVSQEEIAERLQVAMVVIEPREGLFVEYAVGVVLVLELAGGELGDRLPIGLLVGSLGRAVVGERRRGVVGWDQRARRCGPPSSIAAIGGPASLRDLVPPYHRRIPATPPQTRGRLRIAPISPAASGTNRPTSRASAA